MIQPNSDLIAYHHRNVLRNLEQHDRHGDFHRLEESINASKIGSLKKRTRPNWLLGKIGDILVAIGMYLKEQANPNITVSAG